MADVGVIVPRDLPAQAFVRFVARAEELGVDELWIVEDCFFRGGIAQAAVALATTRRVRVGVGILPAGARNPAFTAMEAATLAELFPGRLHLGLGHGMPSWMRQVGAAVASPLTLLEEHLVAVRSLLAGEVVDVRGRYVQLDHVVLDHPPSTPPPVLAGVRGPRSLPLAGRVADGTVLAEPVTPEYLAAARAQIAAPGPHRVVGYDVAVVDDDPAVARRTARAALRDIGEPDWAPHIDPLPFAAEFRALRAQCSTSAEFASRLPDAWVDELALVGDAATVRSRIAALHGAGADSVVLMPVGPDPEAALVALGSGLEAAWTGGARGG